MSMKNIVSHQLAQTTAGMALLPPDFTLQPNHHGVMNATFRIHPESACFSSLPPTPSPKTGYHSNLLCLQQSVDSLSQIIPSHPGAALFASCQPETLYELDVARLLCCSRSTGVYKADSEGNETDKTMSNMETCENSFIIKATKGPGCSSVG